MAYAITDERIGWPGIAATDTVQRVPEGTIAHAVDPVLGGGEFIYLKGVAGTVAGSLVTYDQMNQTTTLGAAGGGEFRRAVGGGDERQYRQPMGLVSDNRASGGQQGRHRLDRRRHGRARHRRRHVGASIAGKQLDGARSINAAGRRRDDRQSADQPADRARGRSPDGRPARSTVDLLMAAGMPAAQARTIAVALDVPSLPLWGDSPRRRSR